MTIISKGVILVLFFSLVVALIALLPSVQQYPLDPAFALALSIILGYYFAWSSIFTFLNTVFALALLSIGLELAIWIAKKVLWVSTLVARMIG